MHEYDLYHHTQRQPSRASGAQARELDNGVRLAASTRFDAVSPVAIGRHRRLALLEAAAQFDNRWHQRPFGKLDVCGSLRSLLDRSPSDLSRTAADSLRTQNVDELWSETLEIFVSRFNAAAGACPALLVCDI